MRDAMRCAKELFEQRQSGEYSEIDFEQFREILLIVLETHGMPSATTDVFVDKIVTGLQRHLRRARWDHMALTVSSVLGDLLAFPELMDS